MVDRPATPVIPHVPSIPAVGAIGPISSIAPIVSPATPVRRTSKLPTLKVGSYWINSYRRCGQKKLDYCDDLANGFLAAMKSRGHAVSINMGEDGASPSHWRGKTDNDPGGIDTIQFAYLATHGSTYGTELPGSKWIHWFLATFDSKDGCIASTVELDPRTWRPRDSKKLVPEMLLGDGDLRWVVFDCCRSLSVRLENERDKGARAQLAEANPGRTWGPCYRGVHMIFGFTGLSSDAWWTSSRGKSFGLRAGRGEALADSWLDEAYSYWVDDVPVVTSFGQTPKEVEQRLKSETITAARQTPTSIRGHIYSTIWRS